MGRRALRGGGGGLGDGGCREGSLGGGEESVMKAVGIGSTEWVGDGG